MADWREAGSKVVKDRHDLNPTYMVEGRDEDGETVRYDASANNAEGQLDMWRRREPEKHWRLLAVTKRFQVIENYRELVDDKNRVECEHGIPYRYRCEFGCDE